MRLLLKLFFIFYFITGFIHHANAQDITGIWRGYFVTDYSDQYKFEIQITQNPSNRLTGVSYSYLDTRFYGKATLTGNINKSSKTALIQEIKTVEVRMSSGSVACIMKCQVNYVKSGNEEFLEGTYTSAYETTSEAEGVRKGGNCGGGKIFLRKVATSDFYVEPFLREKPVAKKTTPAPPVKKPIEQKPVIKAPVKTPPVAKKTTTTKPVEEKKETVNPPQKTKEVAAPAKADRETTKAIIPKNVQIPTETRSRTNELTKSLVVTNEEITVKLYDNGIIDNDTISVYLDNKPILSNKMLTTNPLTITLKMDESNPEHVLIMVAENLGSIPPNTSLMVVQDGDKRYEVRITSTEQKNAMVRFRYQKQAP